MEGTHICSVPPLIFFNSMAFCKNCGHQVDLKFCSHCGQKASVKKLEMKSLLHELPHAIWHVDRGVIYNIIQLFKRPGYAIKDYLDGKRKNFYHPLAYMLLVLGTMLLAMNLMQVHYYDPVQDAGMSKEKAAFWIDYDATQQAWIHYYKFFIPFYLPWMALLYYLWLRVMKAKYTYAECVFISFFNSAQMTIPQIAVLALAYIINDTAFTRISDQLINYPILLFLYFFQFYQLGNPRLKKGLRITLSAAGAIIMLAFAFTAIFTFLWLAPKIGL